MWRKRCRLLKQPPATANRTTFQEAYDEKTDFVFNSGCGRAAAATGAGHAHHGRILAADARVLLAGCGRAVSGGRRGPDQRRAAQPSRAQIAAWAGHSFRFCSVGAEDAVGDRVQLACDRDRPVGDSVRAMGIGSAGRHRAGVPGAATRAWRTDDLGRQYLLNGCGRRDDRLSGLPRRARGRIVGKIGSVSGGGAGRPGDLYGDGRATECGVPRPGRRDDGFVLQICRRVRVDPDSAGDQRRTAQRGCVQHPAAL